MKTINISLPEQLHKTAKNLVAEGKYGSISEVVRAGLRRVFADANKITENGFPEWFEDQVLEAAQEPINKSTVWETAEDIDNYFKKLHKRKSGQRQMKHGKNRTNWQIQPVTR